MSDESQSPDEKPAVPPRIIEAALTRDKLSLGQIEITGSTKQGPTNLLSVDDEELLRVGDAIKTKTYVLNSREFVVVRRHTKPMKLPGFWFEVRPVAAAPAPKPKRR